MPDDAPIRTAVILGDHPIDAPAFHAMLRSLTGVDLYVQNLEDWTTAPEDVAGGYGVLFFYNFHQYDPSNPGDWYHQTIFPGIERFGQVGPGGRKQGIFMFHHAVVAMQQSPVWDAVCGIKGRSLVPHHDETVTTHVEDPEHPITAGLPDWTMIDETYEMSNADPADGNHILLTTEHPQSCHTLAWTRDYKGSRCFNYLAGHDGEALGNANVRTVVQRGMQWCAGRL